MQQKWKPYAGFIALCLAVGGLAGLLTRNAMQDYQNVAKPSFSPPGILFPIVWSILYILMGVSAAMVFIYPAEDAQPAQCKKRGMLLFFVQLAVNFMWSIFFFSGKWYWFSFIWLLLLCVLAAAMTACFYSVRKPAGLLQIPYLLWLSFAAALNFSVALLNPK